MAPHIRIPTATVVQVSLDDGLEARVGEVHGVPAPGHDGSEHGTVTHRSTSIHGGLPA